ncbi:MAG: BrnT family toxin [Dehalococcoidia bacterium]|nr:hypothetical protein [Chloroflexota bacterium]
MGLTLFPDPEHPNSEQRYINIGSSSKGRVLIAIHIERKVNIRIISCRKATTDERRYGTRCRLLHRFPYAIYYWNL